MAQHEAPIPTPSIEDEDHGPSRIAPRHLFDIAVGDGILFRGDNYKWSSRVAAINVSGDLNVGNNIPTEQNSILEELAAGAFRQLSNGTR